jgi:hypothetical protein
MRRAVRQGANRARKQSFKPVVKRTPRTQQSCFEPFEAVIEHRCHKGRGYGANRAPNPACKWFGIRGGCSVTSGSDILALASRHTQIGYEIRDDCFGGVPLLRSQFGAAGHN